MKKKGFTLVELLVVIAIIAMLMSILMPALAKVRQIAQRVVCGTNLSGLGRAIQVYANDHSDKYPSIPNRDWARVDPSQSPDETSITGSLYLLVNGDYAGVKQFICKGDAGSSVLRMSDFAPGNIPTDQLVDATDFGDWDDGNTKGPFLHCSYAYQNPFRRFVLNVASDPRLPVMADRNPFYGGETGQYVTIGTALDNFDYDGPESSEKFGSQKNGNSASHQKEGQNVLYNDTHVVFEKFAFVGIDDDNIYTIWSSAQGAPPDEIARAEGLAPTKANHKPLNKDRDSLLLSENVPPW